MTGCLQLPLCQFLIDVYEFKHVQKHGVTSFMFMASDKIDVVCDQPCFIANYLSHTFESANFASLLFVSLAESLFIAKSYDLFCVLKWKEKGRHGKRSAECSTESPLKHTKCVVLCFQQQWRVYEPLTLSKHCAAFDPRVCKQEYECGSNTSVFSLGVHKLPLVFKVCEHAQRVLQEPIHLEPCIILHHVHQCLSK
eukprot:m.39939 g.39939  ORF g.39939 m.39939 type:complete len:196 (+) comp10369_c0_seq1:43-630(+)